MKIYHNALSEELLQDCWNEVGKLSKEPVWASSCLGWEKNLMIGLSGSTLHTLVPQYNRDRIIEFIKGKIKSEDNRPISISVYRINTKLSYGILLSKLKELETKI